MRTAEEILKDNWFNPLDIQNSFHHRRGIIKAMKQYAKEALEEVMKYIDETDANVIGAERKILSLIQELH
jgi:hypothetical protein